MVKFLYFFELILILVLIAAAVVINERALIVLLTIQLGIWVAFGKPLLTMDKP